MNEPQRPDAWGETPEDRSPPRIPKWLAAAAAVFALALVGLILTPLLIPNPTPLGPVDPQGFIIPPVPEQDAPQRTFSVEARAAAIKHGKFVGVEACRRCHAERVAEYEATNHFLTSQPATRATILGKLDDDKMIPTPNPHLHFKVGVNKKEQPAQTAIVDYQGKTYEFTKAFDIAIGSGLHAQTFLSWKGTRLYQLPMTYSKELDEWVKSPGYQAGMANFGRPASSGCLRCHATYLEELDDAWNSYRPDASLLGLSCEKCHGQGESHVQYRSAPGEKTLEADPIVRPAKLSRQQQLDLCAQCHAGVGKFLQPPFSYRPGNPLREFIEQEELADQQFGVHSTNQLARLMLSKCYGGKQGTMTCTTCHNPHRKEPGLNEAAKKCMTCHQPVDCGKHKPWGKRIETHCIDCHMPQAFDTEADLATDDTMTFPRMRDHNIGRYPKLSKTLEDRWAKQAKTGDATE